MNQYSVAVCDDDIRELNNLCSKISLVLEDNDVNFNINKFTSGESIIDTVIRQEKKFDILFLDILMNEVNGIKAAHKIRETDEDISIVFITSSPNFVFEGYDVQALHYILKPVDPKKLAEILFYDWNRRNEKNYMDVKLKHAVTRILFEDIIYLESRGRKVLIATINGVFETYGVLSEFNIILPGDRFISCHKSFVVNLNYVSRITRNNFTTTYSQIIPISRACYSDAKRAFISFIGSIK